jgi:ABC transporter
VARGEVFGLLGPHGAGKSTTIRMLCTLLEPTSGTVRMAGFDTQRQPNLVRQNLGTVLAGERSLYLKLTARENLAYFAALMSPAARDCAAAQRGIVGAPGVERPRRRSSGNLLDRHEAAGGFGARLGGVQRAGTQGETAWNPWPTLRRWAARRGPHAHDHALDGRIPATRLPQLRRIS